MNKRQMKQRKNTNKEMKKNNADKTTNAIYKIKKEIKKETSKKKEREKQSKRRKK